MLWVAVYVGEVDRDVSEPEVWKSRIWNIVMMSVKGFEVGREVNKLEVWNCRIWMLLHK